MDGDFGGTDGGTAAGAPGSVGDASVGGIGGIGDATGLGSDAGLAAALGDLGFADAPVGDIGLGSAALGDGMGLSGVMSALASLAPVTDLSNALADFSNETALSSFDSVGLPPSFNIQDNSFLSTLRGFLNNPLSKAALALAAARGNPAAIALNSNPAKAALSSNPAGTIGKGAIAAGMTGAFGPIGALGFMGLDSLGAFNSFSNALGNTNAPASFQGNDANMGIGSMLPGLAGMYAGYQGMRDSRNMLGSLQNLYSQDSPYAQSMRQALARRDAASGRRSQYGPREVELQAKLAQMASSQIPAMAGLQRQQMMARNAMLQQGINAYRMAGGWDGIKNALGLSGLFSAIGGNPMSSVSGIENIFGGGGMPEVPNLPFPDFTIGPPIGG